jgi:hypothetical protein
MAFNRFVRRYAAATRDKEFTKELGPILAAHNAVIFNHIVFQLLSRDAVDVGQAISAQVAAWELLWGTGPQDRGLVGTLTGEELEAAVRILDDARTRATVLRTLTHVAESELPQDVQHQLRKAVRHLATSDEFDLKGEFAERSNLDTAQSLAQLHGLAHLAGFPTRVEVADYVIGPLGLALHDVDWEYADVMRTDPKAGKRGRRREQTLVVRGQVDELSCETVKQALARFAAATGSIEPTKDYWRIRFEGNGTSVGCWDGAAVDGFAITDTDDEDIHELEPSWPEWTSRLRVIEAQIRSAVSA